MLANLRAAGFAGRLVPVNAARPTVQGMATVPSVLDAGRIDVAVIAVPAPDVLPVLRQCAAVGVRGAVVLSAGFREAGEAGRQRESQLRAWLASTRLRVIGPNCLGWIRPSARLNLTFAPGMPRAGALGFFSHSGALCTAILDWSREHPLGFSLFASLGNQADVNETDVLDALAADAETRVILGYVEGVADGAAFFRALQDAARCKPCVLLKAGRSSEGARAVGSHTGALAGSDRAFDAAVRQAGAVRVDTLEELFDVGRALVTGRRPTSRAEETHAKLGAALPAHAAVANPIDLVGDATPARYAAALGALDADDASLVVMLAPQAATDAAGIARSVLAGVRSRPTPVLGVLAGGARVRPGVHALEEGGVPCFDFPERAVRALARVTTLAERAAQPATSPPTLDAEQFSVPLRRLAGVARLSLLDAAPLLEAAGIATVPAAAVKTPDAHLQGFLVQRMAGADAHELLLGMVRDPQFGRW